LLLNRFPGWLTVREADRKNIGWAMNRPPRRTIASRSVMISFGSSSSFN
jgi:hypothetical protein